MLKQLSLRYTLFLYGSDLMAVVLGLLTATYLRINIPFGKVAPITQWILPEALYVIALIIWGVLFPFLNVYTPTRIYRIADELRALSVATGICWMVLTGMLYLSFRDVSRLQTLYFLFVYLGLVFSHRLIIRVIFRLRGQGRFRLQPVLVIGTGPIAGDVGRLMELYAWSGLRLVGYLSNGETDQAVPAEMVLGRVAEVEEIIAAQGVTEVVIALPEQSREDLNRLVYQLFRLSVNVRLIPDYFSLAFIKVRVEDFGGMPLLSLREPTLDPFQRLAKRVLDVVLISLSLPVNLPLMAIIALAIRLDSPGPVFFVQDRVGEGGRIFKMVKFRTMVVGAEGQLDQVLSTDDEGHILFKKKDDPRVTRLGRLLRKTSLDELPQLINIIKGEMSIVGPRPEMPWLVESYEPWQRKRFDVPQGLTGWWQVNGRSDRPMHLHTEEDLFYIQNYSLWLDIQIMLRTVGEVLKRTGAY